MQQQKICAQAGPQISFLSSKADIAIYGGAAGGGKTFALLLESVRHIQNKNFTGVIFRRNTTHIRNPGGLWDESTKLYPHMGATPVSHTLEWKFKSGAKMKFSHLEHETTVYDWQGAQVPFIAFDELTHFSASMFWYMVSRNRSMSGVKPYIRGSCNPDADSWVSEFISWWIDQDTGFPIPGRAGVLRWFVRVGDALVWADTPEELTAERVGLPSIGPDGNPTQTFPKSATFVPAKLSDNQALMQANPEYLGNLMAMPTVERERLLSGNWKIRPAAGLLFQRVWCEVVDAIPFGCKMVRYWDLAATAKTETNDPDWTVSVKMAQDFAGVFYICAVTRLRASPMQVEQAIVNTATADGREVEIGIPQDPGAAGKSHAAYLIRRLAGFTVRAFRESGDKVTRFGPFSAQAQAGNIKIVRSAFIDAFLLSLEAFPEATHDDDADACSGAFNMLASPNAMGLFG